MRGAFVDTLVADLRTRMEELEVERRAIRLALRALEAPERPPRPDMEKRLLGLLARSPESRASFLALELEMDTEVVATRLEALESSGAVVRVGLGWTKASR